MLVEVSEPSSKAIFSSKDLKLEQSQAELARDKLAQKYFDIINLFKAYINSFLVGWLNAALIV